jgi:LacI family transcriptional regulator
VESLSTTALFNGDRPFSVREPAASFAHARVAVLVDTATGWGRRMIDGIQRYSRKQGFWRLLVEPRGQTEHLRVPHGWQGDGVIARVSSRAMYNELCELGMPVVNISGIHLPLADPFPTVTTNLRACGKIAAAHLLDRGLQHFAYFGMTRLQHVATQCDGFREALQTAGFTCHLCAPELGKTWLQRIKLTAEWLQTLPKPVGIFAWARGGLHLLDACHHVGLKVPEEVAVLDGDEDDLYEAGWPPLSGVEVPSELIGHEAAACLHRLMKGEPAPPEPTLFPPTRVSARQSTDTLAIDDPEVATAVRFIRANAGRPITVEDVLGEVPISRRSLERRFLQLFGRTPATEIRRVHLERAKQLLIMTDLSISEVAAAAAYSSPEYLTSVFKTSEGMTPLRFRSKMRGR